MSSVNYDEILKVAQKRPLSSSERKEWLESFWGRLTICADIQEYKNGRWIWCIVDSPLHPNGAIYPDWPPGEEPKTYETHEACSKRARYWLYHNSRYFNGAVSFADDQIRHDRQLLKQKSPRV
jgi:hypothetical protein